MLGIGNLTTNGGHAEDRRLWLVHRNGGGFSMSSDDTRVSVEVSIMLLCEGLLPEC